MSESLKDVISRLKAQQFSQQSPKPVEAPKPARVEEDIMPEATEEDEIMEEDEEETPKQEVKKDPKQTEIEQQIMMEIEMLQNNGRFRAELLHQLQEINKALIVIAGGIVNLHEKK